MHRNEPPVLRFRGEQFQRHCQRLGLTTASLQAEHTGLSKWTVSRLLNGQNAPGEHVIACILSAFAAERLGFDDFFEVIEPPRQIERKRAAA